MGTIALMRQRFDRPLDKLVIYATARAYGVEPYLARAWQDGKTAEWTLDYRFIAST